MIGHTLKHGEALHSLIAKGMIERTRSRGRFRMKYISQIMENAVVISYRELEDMTNDRKKWRKNLL